VFDFFSNMDENFHSWTAYYETSVPAGGVSPALNVDVGVEAVLLNVDARLLASGDTFLLRFHEGASAGQGLRFSGGQNYLFRLPLTHERVKNLAVQNLSSTQTLYVRIYVAKGSGRGQGASGGAVPVAVV
jgi:hypothetical protein